jgi:hypothetical protein
MEMPELEPPVRGRALPDEVADLREQVAEEHLRLEAIIQPNVDAHIAAYSETIEEVIEQHRNIAELTDIEIRANTRWSAIWELSGRCLAICRVVVHDLRGGFTSEAVGSLRALFEATVLLGAIAFHEEEEAVRRWLADEDGGWVRPGHARSVMERKEALAKERMRAEGVEPEGRGLMEVGAEIYDLLSRPAHHRRGGFPETASSDLREFTYGPHPNPEVRAHHVDYAGELIETALLVVIDSLGDVIGRDYVREALPRMQGRLEGVRQQFPLP